MVVQPSYIFFALRQTRSAEVHSSNHRFMRLSPVVPGRILLARHVRLQCPLAHRRCTIFPSNDRRRAEDLSALPSASRARATFTRAGMEHVHTDQRREMDQRPDLHRHEQLSKSRTTRSQRDGPTKIKTVRPRFEFQGIFDGTG